MGQFGFLEVLGGDFAILKSLNLDHRGLYTWPLIFLPLSLSPNCSASPSASSQTKLWQSLSSSHALISASIPPPQTLSLLPSFPISLDRPFSLLRTKRPSRNRWHRQLKWLHEPIQWP